MVKGIIASAHEKMKTCLRDGGVAVDATCGKGRDTVFLARYATRVFAFDVRTEAIKATTRALEAEKLADRVTCVAQSHDTMRDVIDAPVRVVAFNLGYFPGGDKTKTTRAETTLLAIKQALTLLEAGGLLALTVYPGHPEGVKEAHAIDAYLSTLPAKHFTVMKEQLLNRHHAPYNVFVYKST